MDGLLTLGRFWTIRVLAGKWIAHVYLCFHVGRAVGRIASNRLGGERLNGGESWVNPDLLSVYRRS